MASYILIVLIYVGENPSEYKGLNLYYKNMFFKFLLWHLYLMFLLLFFSHIIPLPQEFVDYLLADQVVLPEG